MNEERALSVDSPGTLNMKAYIRSCLGQIDQDVKGDFALTGLPESLVIVFTVIIPQLNRYLRFVQSNRSELISNIGASGLMSSQRETVLSNIEEIKPSSPAKPKLSQIELSPSSPIIDNFRQSTIAFKIQRSSNGDAKSALATDNDVPEAKFSVPIEIPKGKENGTLRPLKQTLLPEKPQTDLNVQVPSKPTKKSARSTRTRRPTSRRSVSATAGTSAGSVGLTSEVSQSRAQQACSVSPTKQRHVQSSSKRLQQTQLSDYGIRRTARQFANDLKQKKEAEIVAAILRGEETGMKVVETEDKGRGVITTRLFTEGEFVVEYIGELVSEREARAREVEYKKDPNIGSFMFFFAYGGQRYCVDATEETDKFGRLINHSRQHPNCIVKVIPIDGVPRLSLFAKTDIPPGEELLYDYGDHSKESLLAHPWLRM
nr:histone lysine n methyltransferase setd8 [Hymenolepis microstoma]